MIMGLVGTKERGNVMMADAAKAAKPLVAGMTGLHRSLLVNIPHSSPWAMPCVA